MEQFVIRGGRVLQGCVQVQGAKNAVLPILAAAVLTQEQVTLTGVPDLRDIDAMGGILETLGCTYTRHQECITVHAGSLKSGEMPEHLCSCIRSSVFLMGPLLARLRKAYVPYPGGCEIGLRPIDLHLKGLRMLGVGIREGEGKLWCDGENMHAGDVYLDYPSVGATENVMMAAVLLPGITTIHNAAREPEIQDLARFINQMGGCIRGAGGEVITVHGVRKLSGVTFQPMPDRIVAGTLLCAGAMTYGDVEVKGIDKNDLYPVISKLSETGCRIRDTENGVALTAPRVLRTFHTLRTAPHPGFPTDMQSQMLALSCICRGCTVISENVFENRYGIVPELIRMGADVRVSGRTAIVNGRGELRPAHLHARDLRGGAALVVSALAAPGESRVHGVTYIDRGYDHLETMLSALGADIARI